MHWTCTTIYLYYGTFKELIFVNSVGYSNQIVLVGSFVKIWQAFFWFPFKDLTYICSVNVRIRSRVSWGQFCVPSACSAELLVHVLARACYNFLWLQHNWTPTLLYRPTMLLYMDQGKEAWVIDMNRVQFQTNAIKGQYYILHSSLNLENFHSWSRLHAPDAL